MPLTNHSRRSRVFQRFGELAIAFVKLSIIFFFLLILTRLFELIYVRQSHALPQALSETLLAGLYADLLFFLKASFWLFLLYALLFIFSKRLAKVIYISVACLLIIIQIGLIVYFSSAMVPLAADLYGYSSAEIQQTVGASGSVSIMTIMLFIIAIALVVSAFIYLSRMFNINRPIALLFVLACIIIYFIPVNSLAWHPRLGNEFNNNLVRNKSLFFYRESYRYFHPLPPTESDIYADSYIGYQGDVADSSVVKFDYVATQQYPFLHKADTNNVLAPFFNLNAQPPNIVMLLVEGLGRAFTNDGAYLGNFTPFVDSLSRQSLYWPNFLSEGGRTFAVLPSVLGSLPFGKNGFDELGNNMPPALSLVSLLKTNGYHTAFYCGANARFDNMDIFLKKQAIDAINDEQTFGARYVKLPEQNGFSWGYGDGELFRRYFDILPEKFQQPRLDVLLTVSTHNPFLIREESTYLQRFEERMNTLGFTEKEKADHRNYRLQYATILYADDALKQFFAQYEKLPQFKNTIFLITGDHRMPEIPMQSKLDRYHVPLIVYSPLLSRTAVFRSVSTHFDITPSLLAMLDHQYHFKSPSLVSWMGSGLDTARLFRNIHAYPIMQTKNDLVDFVSGENMLNSDQLFNIEPDLDLDPVDNNDEKKAQLKAAFDLFKSKNQQFLSSMQLIPDSIYQRYFPK